MECADCKHAEHEAGQCKQCNCGESHIVHSKATDTYQVPTRVMNDTVIYGRVIARIPPRKQR